MYGMINLTVGQTLIEVKFLLDLVGESNDEYPHISFIEIMTAVIPYNLCFVIHMLLCEAYVLCKCFYYKVFCILFSCNILKVLF